MGVEDNETETDWKDIIAAPVFEKVADAIEGEQMTISLSAVMVVVFRVGFCWCGWSSSAGS